MFWRLEECEKNLHTIYFLTKPALELNADGEEFDFSTTTKNLTFVGACSFGKPWKLCQSTVSVSPSQL